MQSSHSGSGQKPLLLATHVASAPPKKRSSLANINVPSFAEFKAQTSSFPGQKPLRRKPLPENIILTPARSPSADLSHQTKSHGFGDLRRSFSIDSPSSATARPQLLPSPPASPLKEEGSNTNKNM